jgi:hypothetical protein
VAAASDWRLPVRIRIWLLLTFEGLLHRSGPRSASSAVHRRNSCGRVTSGVDLPLSCPATVARAARPARAPAMLHPSGNRLGGRLELTRQLFGRASRSHQIDHLSRELRRISGSVAGHQTPQKSTSRVSTKPGQLHTSCDPIFRLAGNAVNVAFRD